MTTLNPTARSLRHVALPIEHGGWAFLFEPMVLGMLVAPSLAGLGLCIAGLGVFLLFRPVQVALKDWLKHKRFARTAWAERFILLYALLAAGGMALAIYTARGPFWQAMVLAVPLAGLQMLLVVRGKARDGVTEVSGAVALAALLPMMVIADGGTIAQALALWLVPAARATTSIVCIRQRLKRARGEVYSPVIPIGLHIAAVMAFVVTWLAGWLPVSASIAMAILTVRCWHGLYRARIDIPTKHVGFQEIGWGLVNIALNAVGLRFM
ncbi:MAG TPA: YwiC-like family protein [Anaerolineae bacterium]|jgi:hypothetical protein